MITKLVLRCTVCFSIALLLAAAAANAAAQQSLLVAGPDEGHAPLVRVVGNSTIGDSTYCAFQAYPRDFMGGVRVATGDVDGDGVADIVTAPGPGMEPRVRVFDGRTCRQLHGPLGNFLAYRANFLGGAYVGVADVNGDGLADIITGAGAGGRPVVRVFDGRTGERLWSFLAYEASFRGGVHVAAGDINGDGIAEIITGAGPGGGPHVKVFSPIGLQLLNSFLAYSASFRGGVFVAAGDVNHDGFADIITGPGAGEAPQVKVFDAHHNLALLRSFLAFAPTYTGGVHVAYGDYNLNGVVDAADLIARAGPGSGPQVKVFSSVNNTLLASFLTYPDFTGGVFVAGFKN